MISVIPGVLSEADCAQLRAVLTSAGYVDGRQTAGWNARGVKNNLQVHAGMAGHEAAADVVLTALERSAVFQMAVRPRQLMPILFNRYDVGMSYGPHVDEPVMWTPAKASFRTDVSFTLFLADPASYEGGELKILHNGFEQAVKLPAGGLVAYPSGLLHTVAPVMAGSRFAAVGWVRSDIRDPDQRAILFDLDDARREVFAKDGKSAVFDRLTQAYTNLVRLWTEF